MPLDPQEIYELQEAAREVSLALEQLREARERQNRLWRLLLDTGTMKSEIARFSGITTTAVNHRLNLIRHAKG